MADEIIDILFLITPKPGKAEEVRLPLWTWWN